MNFGSGFSLTKKEFLTFLIPLMVKNQKGKLLQCNLRLSSLGLTKPIFLVFKAEFKWSIRSLKNKLSIQNPKPNKIWLLVLRRLSIIIFCDFFANVIKLLTLFANVNNTFTTHEKNGSVYRDFSWYCFELLFSEEYS